MKFPMKKSRLAWAAALSCLCCAAARADEARSAERLDAVLVTGNPLREREPVQASQALSGDALALRRGATLGETLDGLGGVAASYFGPNSSRPVLRGLDGDRVRMLSNSGASVDASSLSFDHAVPIDPLVAERIEVLRGAAALLYGGSAIGGVVNTLDNRIPRQAQTGLTGAAELRLGGAADERSGALVLDGGDGRRDAGLAWHADLAARKTADQRVPGFDDGQGQYGRHVRNSAGESHGGALGASAQFAQGYAGVSLDDYRNVYGVTVEPDVQIHMQRQRLATAGEWRTPGGLLPRVQWQASRSIYQHQEVEGSGEIGTTFRSRGSDLRLEAEHAALGLGHGEVRGVWGLQWERTSFQALGEEALVPSTRTRAGALFLLEQYRSGPLALSAGLRREAVRIDSAGDAAEGEPARFGPAGGRSFGPRSLALSASYAFSPALSLQANLSDTQRAPTFYELYANGVHVASGAFERGDATLGLERARGLDLGLKWQSPGGDLLRANLYETRFARYIALEASGAQVDDQPEYRYVGVPARLRGFELEARKMLPRMAWSGGWQFSASAQLDGVRGINRASGEALPRLAPLRAGWALEGSDGRWTARLELRQSARQDRVPLTDTPTAGYGLLKLSLARQLKLGDNDALWYLKLDNLGNTRAYSASTVATLRALAPLPGRSLHTGLQVRF